MSRTQFEIMQRDHTWVLQMEFYMVRFPLNTRKKLVALRNSSLDSIT